MWPCWRPGVWIVCLWPHDNMNEHMMTINYSHMFRRLVQDNHNVQNTQYYIYFMSCKTHRSINLAISCPEIPAWISFKTTCGGHFLRHVSGAIEECGSRPAPHSTYSCPGPHPELIKSPSTIWKHSPKQAGFNCDSTAMDLAPKCNCMKRFHRLFFKSQRCELKRSRKKGQNKCKSVPKYSYMSKSSVF